MPDLAPEFQYQQIREEIRAEHALISNRLTWYVTSQSFLVSAFAISRGSGFQWYSWFSTLLLPAIGVCATALISPSIAGAVRTIQIWHVRQKEFLARHPEFCTVFDLRRPIWIERSGLLFPRLIPILFGTFWLVVHVASYFR